MNSYWYWHDKARRNLFNFCVLYENHNMARIILRRGPNVDRKFWDKIIKPQLKADGFEYSFTFAGWTRARINKKSFHIILTK